MRHTGQAGTCAGQPDGFARRRSADRRGVAVSASDAQSCRDGKWVARGRGHRSRRPMQPAHVGRCDPNLERPLNRYCIESRRRPLVDLRGTVRCWGCRGIDGRVAAGVRVVVIVGRWIAGLPGALAGTCTHSAFVLRRACDAIRHRVRSPRLGRLRWERHPTVRVQGMRRDVTGAHRAGDHARRKKRKDHAASDSSPCRLHRAHDCWMRLWSVWVVFKR